MIKRRRKFTVFVKSVWTMLSAFFALLFVFFAVGTSIASENAAALNKTFDTQDTKLVQTGNGGEDLDHYKSDYIERDANGEIEYVKDKNGNKSTIRNDAAMRENSKRVGEQTAVEGSVLLWNKGNALPLKSGARVSVFGIASQNYMFTGTGSGQVDVIPEESGTLGSQLKSKGFTVNDKLEAKYKQLKASYGGKTGYDNSAESNYMPWFEVNEAPYSEVRAIAEETLTADDTAVMIIARTAGEDFDIFDVVKDNPVGGGRKNYLELTAEEAGVLEELNILKSKQKIKNIVLLLNTSNPMQFANITKDKYGVDACVWVGQGGTMSYAQISDVLAGHDEYIVSGRATDTLVYNNHSAPSDANFGDYTWTEYSDKLPDLDKEYAQYYQTHNMKYLVYQEGVYVGYRYYETRYEDTVLGADGATSVKGSTDGAAWDYSKEVAFPFGYGLSYTAFEQTEFDVKENKSGYDVSLKIRNTGGYAGKDVMQVYIQRPYTDYDRQNGIEKPAVELVGFAKTDKLDAQTGEQTLTVSIDRENLRTYDAYGQKTYILEAGDYYLAVGTNAHDALNNILAAKDLTPEQKARMDASGDASKAYKITIDANDYETFATSTETKEEITNRFDDADLNLYEGTKDDQTVKYLSRNDWEGTYPTSAVSLKCVNDVMVRDMQYGHEVAVKENDSLPVYGKTTSPLGKLNLSMLRELEYDDPMWNYLLDQLTLEEQNWLCSYGLGFIAAASSVGAPGGKASDGPAGMRASKFAFPAPVVMAATWNLELMERVGDAMGHEALHRNFVVMYAPGADIHRSPYGGRNWEYYSEDGVLSGLMLAAEVKGVQDVGIIVMTKHFALNDQERNRYGVATFFNEQSARELYLRAFEPAVRKSRMNGVMSSFNRIGCTWAGAHKGLLTDILRNEWNFIGIVETDACTAGNTLQMLDKYSKAEGMVAGNDLWMFNGSTTFFNDSKDNATVMLALREACHRILYTQLHSAAMNGVSINTKIVKIVPWWQALLISASVISGVLMLAGVTMCVLSFVFDTAQYKAYAARRAAARAANGAPKLKPLYRNLIIVGACVLGVAILLTSILVPVLGGDSAGGLKPEAHVCSSVCEKCGKCTDLDCQDPKCADKCGDSKQKFAFEAEDAVREGRLRALTVIGVGSDRYAVTGMNDNKGASVTFAVESPVDTTASLVVTVAGRDRATKFTDLIGVKVNDGEYLVRNTVVSAVKAEDKGSERAYSSYNLGCIDLAFGTNIISFTVLGDGADSAYDFDKIELLTDTTLEAGHMCTTKCPSCGKCSDEDCTDDACSKEKCKCSFALEAEDAECSDGYNVKFGWLEVETNDQGRMYIKNLIGNQGGTISYRFRNDGDPEKTYDVDLYATVSRLKVDTLFSDLFDITVNGKLYTSDAVVPAFKGVDEFMNDFTDASFGEIFLGRIQLRGGENVVSFEVLSADDSGAYNFDKITIRNATHIEMHRCEHVCEICGGCTTDCEYYDCKEFRCECAELSGDVATIIAANNPNVAYANGPNPGQWAGVDIETNDGRTYIKGFNDNVGSWIEFTYNSAGDREALIFLTINRRKMLTVFSDWTDTIVTYADGTSVKLSSKARLEAYLWQSPTDNEWSSKAFTRVCIGKVQLKDGVNKIKFVNKDYNTRTDIGGYNYEKLELEFLGEPLEYAITTRSEGSGNVTASARASTVGKKITVTATPAAGYKLKSLKVYCQDKGENITIDITVAKKFVMPKSDAEIVAEFITESDYEKLPDYAVTFDKNGGNGEIDGVGNKKEYETFNLPNGDGLTKKGGYTFVCWTYEGKDYAAGAEFAMPAKAVTFVAKWEKAPHDCNDVCEHCGGCKTACDDDYCAFKCECAELSEDPPVVIEAEDSKYADGPAPGQWAGVKVESFGDVTCVGGFNNNVGSYLEFEYNSDTDRDALVFITVSRRRIASVFSEWTETSITYPDGATDILANKVTLEAYENQWSAEAFVRVCVGKVSLKTGVNKIRFTSLGYDEKSDLGGYNYDKLELEFFKGVSA